MLNIPQAIRDLFKTDGILKNIRISFPNGEYADICNDRIIKESLKFNESISNREEIKFGICESSQISFDCVDVGNIRGLEIKVDIEIDVTSIPVALRPEECKTSDDVPFPYYPLPLGIFVVDECKRDAGFLKRKVVAYSKSSSFPSYDWWTPLEYLYYGGTGRPFNLNLMNFIVATNNEIFDDSEFTASEITDFVKLNTISPFDYTEFIDPSERITFNSNNGKTYTMVFSIDEGRSYYKEIYPFDTYIHSTPNTNRLGRIDAFTISSNYEYSRSNAKTTLTNAISDAPDLVNFVFGMLDMIGLPNPIMMYRTLYWGNAGLSYSGKSLSEGDIFILPPRLVFPGTASVTIYENETYKCNVGVTYLDSMDDFTISEVTTNYDNMTIPIIPDYIDRETSAFAVSYEQKILYMDMRKVVESYVELHGSFGHIDRYGRFALLSFANLVLDGLFPMEDLFPKENLYPKDFNLPIPAVSDVDLSNAAIIRENYVSSLWYEEYFIAFGGVTCKFLSSEVLDDDGNPLPVLYSLRWINNDRYLNYNVSDNEIIKGNVWTKQGIIDILEPLVAALKTIKFYPHELSCKGLPYIEAGDWVLASFNGNQVKTLCLSRTLSGIQALNDKMKSD